MSTEQVEKPEAEEAVEHNEHGVPVGVPLSFADVRRMQEKLWREAKAEPEAAPAEKPKAKKK